MLSVMETCILELGTHAFRAVGAELDRSGALLTTELARERVPLDASIDETGDISRPAGAHALAALGRLLSAVAARGDGAEVHAIAPDAFALAGNGAAFASAIEKRHRLPVSVLTPRQTMRLATLGARADLRFLGGQAVVVHAGDVALDLGSGTRATLDLDAMLPLGVPRLHRVFGGSREGLPAEESGSLFSVGAAWGFLDAGNRLGRLALHALASEILNATLGDLEAVGLAPDLAAHVGTTAVIADAVSDLLGQREMLLSAAGPLDGAAIEILGRPLRAAAGAEIRRRHRTDAPS